MKFPRLKKSAPGVLLFTGSAILLLAGMFSDLNATVPTAEPNVATVPLLNLWSIWWNCDRLEHGFSGYWDSPIFFPEASTFAFSEPQPATVLLYPIVALTGSLVAAYKAYLLLAVILNGVCGAWCARVLGAGRITAALCGLAIQCLPLVHQQLEVIQLTHVWPTVLLTGLVVKFGRRPALSTSLIAGAVLGLQFWICIHQGLLLVLALFPVAPLMIGRTMRRRRTLLLLVSASVAAALISPIVLPIRAALKEHRFERSPQTVQKLAASPASWFTLPQHAPMSDVLNPKNPGRPLNPGWLRVFSAACGLMLLARRRRHRSAALLLTVLLGATLVFSVSPYVEILRSNLWELITKVVPGAAQVRSVYRFAFISQVLLTLLSFVSVGYLVRRSALSAGSHRTAQLLGGTAGVILSAAIIAEVPPQRMNVSDVPDIRLHQQWLSELRSAADGTDACLCIPFSAGSSVHNFDSTARWMFFGTEHQVPIANGYSGFFPQSYFELQALMDGTRLTPAAVALAAKRGVRFLVVSRTVMSPSQVRNLAGASVEIQLLFADPAAMVDLYELQSEGSQRSARGAVRSELSDGRLPHRQQ